MADARSIQTEIDRLRAAVEAVRARLQARFVGQDAVVEELLVALLAGGHVLLEGAPGLGKTMLVRTLASALDLEFRRVQCTPDLMPADVLGTRVLHEDEHGQRRFRFERGPVFTHVLLADEINRATPRTQAALLEAMAEQQVTIFGERHVLESPFFVVATQNPIEMEGTYPLPEAQLDRFLLKIEVASPSLEALVSILGATTGTTLEESKPGLRRADLLAAREFARQVPTSRDVLALAARIVVATRPDDPSAGEKVRRCVRFGSSPRGAQSLILCAKARALLAGRLHVTEDDVERLAASALRHRLILNYEAEAGSVSAADLAREAVERAGVGGG